MATGTNHAASQQFQRTTSLQQYAFISNCFPAMRITNANCCSLIVAVGIYKIESLMRPIITLEVFNNFKSKLAKYIQGQTALSAFLNQLQQAKQQNQPSHQLISNLILNQSVIDEYVSILRKLTAYEMTLNWNKTIFKTNMGLSLNQVQSIILGQNNLDSYTIPFLEQVVELRLHVYDVQSRNVSLNEGFKEHTTNMYLIKDNLQYHIAYTHLELNLLGFDTVSWSYRNLNFQIGSVNRQQILARPGRDGNSRESESNRGTILQLGGSFTSALLKILQIVYDQLTGKVSEVRKAHLYIIKCISLVLKQLNNGLENNLLDIEMNALNTLSFDLEEREAQYQCQYCGMQMPPDQILPCNCLYCTNCIRLIVNESTANKIYLNPEEIGTLGVSPVCSQHPNVLIPDQLIQDVFGQNYCLRMQAEANNRRMQNQPQTLRQNLAQFATMNNASVPIVPQSPASFQAQPMPQFLQNIPQPMPSRCQSCQQQTPFQTFDNDTCRRTCNLCIIRAINRGQSACNFCRNPYINVQGLQTQLIACQGCQNQTALRDAVSNARCGVHLFCQRCIDRCQQTGGQCFICNPNQNRPMGPQAQFQNSNAQGVVTTINLNQNSVLNCERCQRSYSSNRSTTQYCCRRRICPICQQGGNRVQCINCHAPLQQSLQSIISGVQNLSFRKQFIKIRLQIRLINVFIIWRQKINYKDRKLNFLLKKQKNLLQHQLHNIFNKQPSIYKMYLNINEYSYRIQITNKKLCFSFDYKFQAYPCYFQSNCCGTLPYQFKTNQTIMIKGINLIYLASIILLCIHLCPKSVLNARLKQER